MSGNSLKLALPIVLVLLSNFSNCNEKKYKILGLFSHPGKSHFDMFKPILEELANRGHDLTVLSYFPRNSDKSPKLSNYKDIDLRTKSGIYLNVIDLTTINHNFLSPINEFRMIYNWGLLHCQEIMENADVRKLIKSDEKFDLIIIEVFNSDCLLGFVDKFKAPFVGISSHMMIPWGNYRILNEQNPSYTPDIFSSFEPNMSFMQRLVNTFYSKAFALAYDIFQDREMGKIVRKEFGNDLPNLSEIGRNISAILVNTHHSLHGVKPHLPNVIEVGGVHSSKDQHNIPEDILKFLDEGKEGVLYFSLGSMIKASTMSQERLEIILKVLGTIPRRVIWKWENENLPGKSKNMMIKKWLPQSAILAHPNVKCYFAHGGALGLSEGVSSGVPMIIMPIFGDQFANAASAKFRGVAEILQWSNFNEKTLRNAVDKVFNDSTYGKNAKRLQKAWHDRPEPALQTAIWWLEYIARGNGNGLLKNVGYNLNWFQRHLLDIWAFLILIILIIAIALYKILFVIIKKLTGSKRKSSRDEKSSKKRN